MSQREVNSLVTILSDPENQNRSAEEVAQLCIDELDSLRATSHRLAVVGQITYGPESAVQTVVLGPFRAPLKVSDEERLQAALERPCTAAREAGRHLAWDSKTGVGTGRFMLAPAFAKPRDAWDFYRNSTVAEVIDQAVTADIVRDVVPACLCGLRSKPVCIACGRSHERFCAQHEPEKAAQACRITA
ncbi:hypothetical protein [Streptomyces misionensis]|uniref:hypothetical protein n=1 Tax=Streptomyces misionensis TaxID=67331 RepID=UPI0036C89589